MVITNCTALYREVFLSLSLATDINGVDKIIETLSVSSTTNCSLQNEHKVELTPLETSFNQKRNIQIFMKAGFIAGLFLLSALGSVYPLTKTFLSNISFNVILSRDN